MHKLFVYYRVNFVYFFLIFFFILYFYSFFFFFFSSRRRHTRYIGDWSSDVCSSDLGSRDFATHRSKSSTAMSCEIAATTTCAARFPLPLAWRSQPVEMPAQPAPCQIGRASCRERV